MLYIEYRIRLLILLFLAFSLSVSAGTASSQTLPSHTITATAGENGAISPSGDVIVGAGLDQTFEFIPAPGYHVSDVQVNGVSIGAVSSYTFTGVTSDGNTINVSFAIDTFTLTIAKNGTGSGNVSTPDLRIDCGSACFAVYNRGDLVTLTASPDAHSEFTGWTGDCSGTETACTVTMDMARTAAPEFMLAVPPLPSSLTATVVSPERIDLSWDDNTDVETGFVIERKTDIGGVYFKVAVVGPDVTAYSDNVLRPNTTYYYRVKSVNSDVSSGYSAETSATTMQALPETPLNLAARSLSADSAVVSWTDNSVNETGFVVEKKVGKCNSSDAWQVAADMPANSVSAYFSGLLPDTHYAFRGKAYNRIGESSYSRCAYTKTGLPGTPLTPTGFTAAARSASDILLEWKDNSDDETGFRIYRQVNGGIWDSLITVARDITSYHDSTAAGNGSKTSYAYRIRACNPSGCSITSSIARVPFKPLQLTASTTLSDRINLTWTNVDRKTYNVNIYRKAGGCSSEGSWEQLPGSGLPATTYSDTGLSPGSTYSYRVQNILNSDELPQSSGVSRYSNCSEASTVIPALVSISVKPAAPRIPPGKTLQFRATGIYSDGIERDLTASATWSSSDDSLLAVNYNGRSGLASALAAGTAGVSASFGDLSSSAAVSITDLLPANIVFLLTDDMAVNDLEFMPNLEALLLRQGMNLTSTFVSTSLCCPSRTSILRGQYAHNHSVYSNEGPLGGFEGFMKAGLDESTVAGWLQDAGYRTVLIGKFLNGYPLSGDVNYVPRGWDEWYGSISNAYYYYNYQMNENGVIVKYGGAESDYLTDVEAEKAYDFILRTSTDWRPFFLYLTPKAPHVGQVSNADVTAFPTPVPALRHQNLFADLPPWRPFSFNEEDMSDKPAAMQLLPLFSPDLISQIDERTRLRLQSLMAVDEMLAGLINALSSAGKLENTYIFFMSDNGYHFGEHRLAIGKGTCYDESIRVPLVVRGPGIPAGATDDHLVLNTDLAPTFSAIAEVAVPEFVDGRSLLGLLNGTPVTPEDWRNSILIEVGRTAASRRSAVRTKDHKYVRWNKTNEVEFYNLLDDPYEVNSLHNTADPGLLKAYSDRLDLLNQCAGQGCRYAEDLPAP